MSKPRMMQLSGVMFLIAGILSAVVQHSATAAAFITIGIALVALGGRNARRYRDAG